MQFLQGLEQLIEAEIGGQNGAGTDNVLRGQIGRNADHQYGKYRFVEKFKTVVFGHLNVVAHFLGPQELRFPVKSRLFQRHTVNDADNLNPV